MSGTFSYLIRADGSNDIGLGHIYRTRTLANCLGRHNVIYLSNDDKVVSSLLSGYRHVVLPETSTSETIFTTIETLIKQHQISMIISDLLHYDANYLQFVKRTELKMVTFHEHLCRDGLSDIVINYNTFPGFLAAMDADSPHCLGPKYTIFPELLRLKDRICLKDNIRKVFISFGGSDPGGLTRKIMDAMEESERIARDIEEIMVHLGPANRDREDIETKAALSAYPYKLYTDVADVHGLMCESDLALSAGGNMMYELCYLGVPAIIVPQNAHQEQFGRELSHVGAVSLPCPFSMIEGDVIVRDLLRLSSDSSLRKKMHEVSCSLFDKDGVVQIINKLKRL